MKSLPSENNFAVCLLSTRTVDVAVIPRPRVHCIGMPNTRRTYSRNSMNMLMSAIKIINYYAVPTEINYALTDLTQ